MHDMHQSLREIFGRQTHAFKINLSFGMILAHTETGRHRYFRPYDNQSVLEEPVLVSERADIQKVVRKLSKMDVLREAAKTRPDTKWRLVILTNIRFKVYNTNYVLGAVDKKKGLPDYI